MGRNGIFDEPPPALSDEDRNALITWSGVRLDTDNVLASAGAMRNIERWASVFGLKVLAQLISSGRVPPMSDPCEALDEIIYQARDTSGR